MGNEENGACSLWNACAHTLRQLPEVVYQAACPDVLAQTSNKVAVLEYVTNYLFDH